MIGSVIEAVDDEGFILGSVRGRNVIVQSIYEGIGSMRKTGKFVARFWGDEGGAAAAEYALLLAIIAAGLAVAAGTLGSAISNAMDNASNCIDAGPNCSP